MKAKRVCQMCYQLLGENNERLPEKWNKKDRATHGQCGICTHMVEVHGHDNWVDMTEHCRNPKRKIILIIWALVLAAILLLAMNGCHIDELDPIEQMQLDMEDIRAENQIMREQLEQMNNEGILVRYE